MRILSGVTDQYVYFVGSLAGNRVTGLATFTVRLSRNGGASVLMTTPTINETDSANMPGVYELLLDEETTVAAGNDTEELAIHITEADMDPVTRTIELYRGKITAGNTLTVEADGDLTKVNTLHGHTAQTADNDIKISLIPTTAMRGTDNAALASVCTEVRLAELAAANLPTDIAAIPLTAMRGTDGANTVVPDAAGIAATQAEVATEVAAALVAIHLDHLLAVDYDPASKPGIATALLNELIESNAGVSRYTAGALAQAPAGGGGGDATEAKQDLIIAAVITNAAGVDVAADIIAIKTVADAIPTTAMRGTDGVDTAPMRGTNNALLATADGTTLTEAGGTGNHLTALATAAALTALNNTSIADILASQLTESYAADGVAPTLSQLLFMVMQTLGNFGIVGTTLTVRKIDGVAVAATFALDSATAPTDVNRAT